jgi:oxalate decarboxylase
VQLPPGAKVAHHDPKDIEAMPNFKYSLDGNDPKITSGGWAKRSNPRRVLCKPIKLSTSAPIVP